MYYTNIKHYENMIKLSSNTGAGDCYSKNAVPETSDLIKGFLLTLAFVAVWAYFA
ncbi:MAG: hypothetical protein OEY06_01855 [Gammaproteobacteria bacterium]|nr:hypothetical protein [Gammaproteobacteria bacterium]